MKHRLGAVLPAIGATLGMAAILGGAVAIVIVWASPEAVGIERFLRTWAISALIALPLGFVFGVPLLAVVRSLRRRSPPEA